MKNVFVNLKRFDVPRNTGGVCGEKNPDQWIRQVVRDSVELGIGALDDMHVVYMIPEALIIPALGELNSIPSENRGALSVGCQSVFREDVKPGGNFGAFTANLPAAAAKNIGCTWTMIGHSEERKDKQGIIGAFATDWNSCGETRGQVMSAVSSLLNSQVLRAMEQGLKVLFCVGETAEQRGDGNFEEQKPRIEKVLADQLRDGLNGIQEYSGEGNIVIGYEPVWAIGPGKTPPGKEYIAFVSTLIKDIGKQLFDRELPVVYGGGLKLENAGMISSIETIDGGLVALTRFSGEIGFYVEEFKAIIDAYNEYKD